LWNKSLLKFSPHLKSVAALSCETWNGGESLTPLSYHALRAGALSCWNMSEWLSSFLTAHEHIIGYSVPWSYCILLEYEIVTRYFLDAWQQLLLLQYFTIIVAVHFHSRLHNFIFQQAVHLRTGHMTQSHFYAERCQTSFLPISGPQTAQIGTPLIIRSGL